VALRSGIPERDLETYDERLPGFWQRVASALASSSPEPEVPSLPYGEQLSALSVHDKLVAITRAVIEEAAQRGNAVIVGRGAAFILGKRPGMLHVQLFASVDARIRWLLARVEELPAEARPEEKSLRELCQSIDAERAEYVRRLFNADWLDARHYDLAIDSGRIGVARTVDIIEHAVGGVSDSGE
jgi:cytidylate kinase